MFCTRCGAPLRDGAKFCPQCGAALNVDPVQAKPSTEPADMPEVKPNFDPVPSSQPEQEPKPIYEPTPEQEPRPIFEPTPEQEPKPSFVPTPEQEPKPSFEPTPEQEPKPIFEPAPEPKPKPSFVPNPEPAPQPEPKPRGKDKTDKQRAKTKKSSPGAVVLSILLCVVLFVFASLSSAVGILRNVLGGDYLENAVDKAVSDSDDIAGTIYDIAENILGEKISNHPELTENSVKDAIDAVKKDDKLMGEIKEYVKNYSSYLINGGKIDGIDGDGIIDIIDRINNKSEVYRLSEKDKNEIRDIDLSSAKSISGELGFSIDIARYALSLPVYIVLIVVTVCVAVLILCANSWRPRAISSYVAAVLIIIGVVFIIASGGAFALSFAVFRKTYPWLRGISGYPIILVAVRGVAYFSVGLVSALIGRAARKKRAVRESTSR